MVCAYDLRQSLLKYVLVNHPFRFKFKETADDGIERLFHVTRAADFWQTSVIHCALLGSLKLRKLMVFILVSITGKSTRKITKKISK
jgi:glutamyl/glutaminyl-tRNA synthetase